MLVYIAVAVAIIIVVFLIIVAIRPAAFRIARSREIPAPADAIFPLINNLRQWSRWSPFEKLDPAMKKTFDGPDAGAGSDYRWVGNGKAGAGQMTIVESKMNELVAMTLEFTRPFKCHNQVQFVLAPSVKGTSVSWIMEGRNNFMAKAFSLLMNIDKMVGKDFEQGLENLEAVARGIDVAPSARA